MSKFILKREFALQMPTSFVDIDRDEMEYVDGGYRSSRRVWIPAGSKRMRTSQYIDTSYAKSAIGGAVVTSVVGLLVPPAWAFGIGVAAGIISAAGSNTAAKAEAMDKADGKKDGWLTVRWSGMYKTEYNPYPPNSYQGAMF